MQAHAGHRSGRADSVPGPVERRPLVRRPVAGRRLLVVPLRQRVRQTAGAPKTGALAGEGEGDPVPVRLLEFGQRVRVDLFLAPLLLASRDEVVEVVVLVPVDRCGRVAELRRHRGLDQRRQRTRPGQALGRRRQEAAGPAPARRRQRRAGDGRAGVVEHVLRVVVVERVPVVVDLHTGEGVVLPRVWHVDAVGQAQIRPGEPVRDRPRRAVAEEVPRARLVDGGARGVGAPREGAHLVGDLISGLPRVGVGGQAEGVEAVRLARPDLCL
eukprot:CAMPEP_0176238044 /NCGR_PEP_ID=MMETSP0121_2-20121125/28162_1 /TAXON_ID=160619 /ORGANISM="Kryptoperidinium foliaceum, Strain CCMP 1326" /LENGTH=269 /DNA_ID=CAMNT_0017577507 /DNA_START=87 /DNA_END=892 /DNA_ORIENTATION=-